MRRDQRNAQDHLHRMAVAQMARRMVHNTAVGSGRAVLVTRKGDRMRWEMPMRLSLLTWAGREWMHAVETLCQREARGARGLL